MGGRGFLNQQMPYLVSIGLAVAGAFGALGYLLMGGREQILAIAVVGALLGIAQIFLLLMNYSFEVMQKKRLRFLAKEQARAQELTNETIGEIQMRMTEIEARELSQSGEVLGRIEEIKTSFASFHDVITATVANAVTPQVQPEIYVAPPEVIAAPVVQQATSLLADQISYALEPVVDMPTKRTAHYRLHASLALGDEAVTGDAFLHASSAAGKRAMIDQLAIEEALGLLERLRQRDPHLCILVPMGAETLQSQVALANILGAITASPFANGLIIEVPHVVLAGLGESGIEGLAVLARQGLVFALSNASIVGLDLDAMKILNVKLVGLNAASVSGASPSETLLGFAQMARLARVNIYVTDVTNPASVAQLSSFSRLACGPCFAEPRRVKRANDLAHAATAMAA